MNFQKSLVKISNTQSRYIALNESIRHNLHYSGGVDCVKLQNITCSSLHSLLVQIYSDLREFSDNKEQNSEEVGLIETLQLSSQQMLIM